MKLEVLGEFIALVKYGTVSRTARELYISQPSLSAHIAGLERELGFALFDRDERGVTLTPAGASFLGYAQTVVDTLDEAKRVGLEAARRAPAVRMKEQPATGSLLPALKAAPFHVSFVEVDPNLTLLDALVAGVVDIGVGADYQAVDLLACKAQRGNIARLPAGYLECSVVVMASHPLACKEHLTRADLDGQTVLISGGPYFDEWRAIVEKAIGPDVALKFRMSAAKLAADIAREDLGDAIHICGREANADYYRHRTDVRVFTELDEQPLRYPNAVMYLAESPNPEVARFAAYLQDLLTREG